MYLVGESAVFIRALENQSESQLNSFPETLITIVSQSVEGITRTAKELRLPLEKRFMSYAPAIPLSEVFI